MTAGWIPDQPIGLLARTLPEPELCLLSHQNIRNAGTGSKFSCLPITAQDRASPPAHRRETAELLCQHRGALRHISIPGNAFVGPHARVVVDELVLLGFADSVEMVAQPVGPETVHRRRVRRVPSR